MLENTKQLVREIALSRKALEAATAAFERAKQALHAASARVENAEIEFKKNGEDGHYIFRGLLVKRWTSRTTRGDLVHDVRIEEASLIEEITQVGEPS